MATSCAKRRVIWLGCLCLLAIWACARTPPPHYYTLSPLPAADRGGPQAPGAKAPAILVGPIRFPPYLDTTGIVTRTSDNAIEVAQLNLWAGPLAETFPRVLADNLSILLATDLVSVYPRLPHQTADYQVVGEVVQFDGSLAQQVSLVIRWSLVSVGERKPVASRQSRISVPVGAAGYAGLAAAQSQAVAQLGRDIAAAIREQPR
jgi:uncharacterized lipoprotein YmbA